MVDLYPNDRAEVTGNRIALNGGKGIILEGGPSSWAVLIGNLVYANGGPGDRSRRRRAGQPQRAPVPAVGPNDGRPGR